MRELRHELLTMRRAQAEDMLTYFRWANDSAVRQNSYTSEPIPLESHKAWFERKVSSHDSFLYILEHGGEPAGQIRFDIRDGVAHIGFSIDEAWRGCGLGTHLLRYGTEMFQQDASEAYPVHGAVKVENIPSLKAFAAAGFHVLAEAIVEGEQSIVFIYPGKQHEG